MSKLLGNIRSALAFISASLCFAVPAAAQITGPSGSPGAAVGLSRSAGPIAPQAEVRVFSTGSEFGPRAVDLINGSVASLCVNSSTGRFRLRVSSQSGGAMVAPHSRQALPYTVVLRDPMGVEHIKPMSNADVVFEGQSRPGSTCTQGANATMAVLSADRDVSAVLAGEYFEQLRLSVEPL